MMNIDTTDLVVIKFSRISHTTGKTRTGFLHHVDVNTHKAVMSSRPKALCLTRAHLSTLAANMEKYADRHADVVPGSVQMIAADAADTARYVAWREAYERAYPTK